MNKLFLVRFLGVALFFCILGVGCGVFTARHDPGTIVDRTAVDHYLNIDGVNYHYQDYPGPGTDVFLLHGFGSSTYTWAGVAPILQRHGYHVYALDMKGFGWSDKPLDADYDPLTLAEEVNRFLVEMKLDNVVFVGNSLGGGIALLTAILHPQRVRSLVLVDAAGYPMDTPTVIGLAELPGAGICMNAIYGRWLIEWNLGEVLYNRDRLTEERLNAYYERLRSRDALDAMVSLARAIDFDALRPYVERNSEVKVPALLIWGREDAWVPLKYGYRFRRDLPNSILHIIDDCGHIPEEEVPELTGQLIMDFVEGRPVRDFPPPAE